MFQGSVARRLTAAFSFIAALALPALPAGAQQPQEGALPQGGTWRQASGSGGQSGYIDTASMQRTGDRIRFWREIRTREPQNFRDGQSFDRLGASIEVDCRARTFRTIELYAKLGEQLVGRTDAEDREAREVPAGTTTEAEFRAVCFNEWPG